MRGMKEELSVACTSQSKLHHLSYKSAPSSMSQILATHDMNSLTRWFSYQVSLLREDRPQL